MEDSSYKHLVDQPTTESQMNRRDMTKLLGVVTALSVSLGVTLVTSAATGAEGATLKLRFLKQAPNGDPAKAELLCTIDISPEDERKIVTAGGPIELRVVRKLDKMANDIRARERTDREVTISSQTIPAAAWLTIKQDSH